MPNDRLAGELLRMVQGPPQQPAAADFGLAPTPAPDATLAPTPDPIDKSLLPGTWHASRPDGSKFVLALIEGGTFDWKFILPNKKGEDFGGTYTVNGPVLILKRQPELNRQDSGALAGTVTFRNDEHFLFKLVGSPPDDQGLEFKR